jgi:hypothetical protein
VCPPGSACASCGGGPRRRSRPFQLVKGSTALPKDRALFHLQRNPPHFGPRPGRRLIEAWTDVEIGGAGGRFGQVAGTGPVSAVPIARLPSGAVRALQPTTVKRGKERHRVSTPFRLGNAASTSEHRPSAEPGWRGSTLAPSENSVTRRGYHYQGQRGPSRVIVSRWTVKIWLWRQMPRAPAMSQRRIAAPPAPADPLQYPSGPPDRRAGDLEPARRGPAAEQRTGGGGAGAGARGPRGGHSGEGAPWVGRTDWRLSAADAGVIASPCRSSTPSDGNCGPPNSIRAVNLVGRLLDAQLL